MKKTVLLSTIVIFAQAFVFVAGLAAAPADLLRPKFEMSAGLGLNYVSDFAGGYTATQFGQDYKMTTPYHGGGLSAFFDATYAEVSVGFFGAGGSWLYSAGDYKKLTPMTYMGMDFSLLGKYPFHVSDQFKVFPMLGIDYRLMLGVWRDGTKIKDTDNITTKPLDYSALWFKVGAGTDFQLTDHFSLRGELLYGFRLPTKAEKDWKDLYGGQGASVKTCLGHGLSITVAAGATGSGSGNFARSSP
jgi:hypothetical protein